MKKSPEKRLLRVIEGLCLGFHNGAEDLKNAKITIDTIYEMAHLTGHCENPHLAFWRKFRELEKELTKAGLI